MFVYSGYKKQKKKVGIEARLVYLEQKKVVWHLMEVEVFKNVFTCFVEMSSKHTQAGASFKLIELVRHGLVKALSWLLISTFASVSS